MVVFVCSQCNSSLKKNQVNLHSCNGKFSCFTCNAEFNKSSYQSHDRCISEAEKYQGIDYKSNKNENKGLNRQQNWNEFIIEVFDNYTTTNQQLKQAMNQLKSFSNIPSKEAKFLNFFKNVGKRYPHLGKQLWNIIMESKESMNKSKEKSESETKVENTDVNNILSESQNGLIKEVKKRKIISTDESVIKELEPIMKKPKLENNGDDKSDKLKKKKRENTNEKENKKKNKESTIEVDKKSEDCEKMDTDEIVIKEKSKKKKNKKSKETNITEIILEKVDTKEQEESKKKKYKKNDDTVKSIEETKVELKDELKPKKKKSKQSKDAVKPTEEVKVEVKEQSEEMKPKKKKNKKNVEFLEKSSILADVEDKQTVEKEESGSKSKKKDKKNKNMTNESVPSALIVEAKVNGNDESETKLKKKEKKKKKTENKQAC